MIGEGYANAVGRFFEWLSGSDKRKLRDKLTSCDEYVRITEPLITKYVKSLPNKSKLLNKKLKLLTHHKKRIRAY